MEKLAIAFKKLYQPNSLTFAQQIVWGAYYCIGADNCNVDVVIKMVFIVASMFVAHSTRRFRALSSQPETRERKSCGMFG